MTNLFILKMKKLKTFCAVAKIELKKIADNEPQISEGTNSVGIVRGIWAFAYVLLCAVFLLKNLT